MHTKLWGEPGAGHWTGNIKLAYEAGLESTFDVIYTTNGDLSFDIVDPPPLSDPPPPNTSRRPLGSPAQPQPAVTSGSADDAGTGRSTQDETTISGTSTLRLEVSRGPLMPPTETIAGGTNDVRLSVGGEFTMEPDDSYPSLELTLSQVDNNVFFGVQTTEISPDGRTSGDGRFTPNGSAIAVTGPDGRTATVQVPANQQVQPGPVGRLKVIESGCGTMSGIVEMPALTWMQQTGLKVQIIENAWSASLNGRDPAFEQRVDALVNEPLPTVPTYAYIDAAYQSYIQLRNEASQSSYRLCVIRKLDRKMVTINLWALQYLLDEFPKAQDAAGCAVFNAALERIFAIVQRLQLLGVDCPLLEEWKEVAGREVREAIRLRIQAGVSYQQLECFLFQGGTNPNPLDYKDVGPLLQDYLNQLRNAAPQQ